MTQNPKIDFPPFLSITLIFVALIPISPLLKPIWRPPLQISSYSPKPGCQVNLPLALSESPTITLYLISTLRVVSALTVTYNTSIARLMDLYSPHFDVLWLKIYLPTTTIFLCFCYCSPNDTNFPSFLEYLTSSHESLLNSHPRAQVLYIGDFNVHHTDWTPNHPH